MAHVPWLGTSDSDAQSQVAPYTQATHTWNQFATQAQCQRGRDNPTVATKLSFNDDLTCLSWLHQRCNLLPLQPLHKVTPLPQIESSESSCSISQVSSKPPYSFSSLIFMAIEDSPGKKLPVKDIYEWIVNNFPYYRTATGGWRNSVRHNLSLSKSFRRIQRDKSQVSILFAVL
uniref:Fork-head domain-containing protein n=1 Tax=Periophthalmus magnuspinnatus TaxID=409849 RepID=A0A3B4AX51_9GOBI